MKVLLAVSLLIMLSSPVMSTVSLACKDIVIMGPATGGSYNLLMKVRDPSRPGPQVLCLINDGYMYRYHLPDLKGSGVNFVVKHKFIGVVTKGDCSPNIVKAGISLSDAGIAYGDADSPSFWINPLRTAWDDFDWLRYAYQTAEDEDQAISLLEQAVDKFHAPGVSENLFVVGPRKGYVMEGDAVRYTVKEVKDIYVMSNYPKELWRYRILRRVFISKSFDYEKEVVVRRGSLLRLGGVLGVRIVDVNAHGIYAKLWPVGTRISISVGQGGTIGPFWIKVIKIERGRCDVRISYKYKVWEDKIKEMLKERYGRIEVKDLMRISRLHSDDLGGLRGLCERYYKATAICKIPHKYYNTLSCMWFAPDQCSSIYIPVHICCKRIYDPYTDGRAADVAKKILDSFGHGGFSDYAQTLEKLFLKETNRTEEIAESIIRSGGDPSEFMTDTDLEMQRQAYLTEKLVLYLRDKGDRVPLIWGNSFSDSLLRFLSYGEEFDEKSKEIIEKIAESIARLRFYELKFSGNLTELQKQRYMEGLYNLDRGDFERGLLDIYGFMDNKKEIERDETMDKAHNLYMIQTYAFLLIVIIAVSYFLIKKR